MREIASSIYQWLDERLSISTLRDAIVHKTVPVHRATPIYFLGWMTLFFLVVQIVTGILLMLYYRPSAEQALSRSSSS